MHAGGRLWSRASARRPLDPAAALQTSTVPGVQIKACSVALSLSSRRVSLSPYAVRRRKGREADSRQLTFSPQQRPSSLLPDGTYGLAGLHPLCATPSLNLDAASTWTRRPGRVDARGSHAPLPSKRGRRSRIRIRIRSSRSRSSSLRSRIPARLLALPFACLSFTAASCSTCGSTLPPRAAAAPPRSSAGLAAARAAGTTRTSCCRKSTYW
jgi:hypothetical protein